ncbi:putative colanic acid biosynthesis acetyltransferase [Martelella radicis]|uniref:Putative colanic acid biosynthesis acetyltransferase WcaF n=1 Tax=Martelella radicis TaxID=1397476 RepID=A0A7W6KMR3_9HYPH|nr:putative colanic acid biosynthesis acetyltransferase [Martelella radicis]MBB4122705.1 putative colanic acid biosynthesis acetyltransferase WcaF [Martelella radicis]
MAEKVKRLYVDEMSFRLRLRRLIWRVVYLFLFRPTPRFIVFDRWRLFLLRRFGARIGKGSRVAPDCFVWAPWNLEMGNYACLAEGVDCYTIGPLKMGDYTTVSQRAFICTASHEIKTKARRLFSRPITICDHAWVAAEAFVGPGVTIGEGSVVGARSVVVRDIEPWKVVGGNPARVLKDRTLSEDQLDR